MYEKTYSFICGVATMTACSDSDSTGGNGNEYSCNVSRKGNSVEIDASYKDERAQEIVTLVSGDDFMTVTNKKNIPERILCAKRM